MMIMIDMARHVVPLDFLLLAFIATLSPGYIKKVELFRVTVMKLMSFRGL